jgi:hypothetical protein
MSCPACGATNGAAVEAMERLRRKNEALEIEKAQALARFEELQGKYFRAKARVKELEEKLKGT